MSRKTARSRCQLGTTNLSNACGYCHLHRCPVTVKQMKNRECLRKQCRNFVPWKQHGYWTDRAQRRRLWWDKEAARV